jgi:hypothetical protein
MTKQTLTERQREKWRLDRARIRLIAKNFPKPPKVVLTPEEKREIKNHKAREARAAKALAMVDLSCPMFHADGRIIRQKPARKPSKPAHNRPKGPWDYESGSTA